MKKNPVKNYDAIRKLDSEFAEQTVSATEATGMMSRPAQSEAEYVCQRELFPLQTPGETVSDTKVKPTKSPNKGRNKQSGARE